MGDKQAQTLARNLAVKRRAGSRSVDKASKVKVPNVKATNVKKVTGYGLYVKKQCPEVKERLFPGQPMLKRGQVRPITAGMAQIWRALIDEQKASYRQQADMEAGRWQEVLRSLDCSAQQTSAAAGDRADCVGPCRSFWNRSCAA